MDYLKMFDELFPGFFDQPGIRSLPEELIFSELVMDLRKDSPKPLPYPYPEEITFGEYSGDIGTLQSAVSRVDADWPQYFSRRGRVFCAFDEDRIASFCILTDWGVHESLHIGGPGCVGTVPEYRKKGIGLEMVRRATTILKEEGFDISWIHYTHVEKWYEKLGYKTVLRWSGKGII